MTKRVAYGTVVRLTCMTFTALILFTFSNLPGAVVGASALSSAVLAEAIASRLMANKILKQIKDDKLISEEILTYKSIFNSYYPLALTSLIGL